MRRSCTIEVNWSGELSHAQELVAGSGIVDHHFHPKGERLPLGKRLRRLLVELNVILANFL